FSMTLGSDPSITAMQELVVPRSIPIVFAISIPPLAKSKRGYSKFAVVASTLAMLAACSPAHAVVPGANGRIAFVRDRDGNDVIVMHADGTNVRRLTANAADDGAPSWSPDGSRIAFASNRDGDFEIYIRARGGAVTRVTRNGVADVDPNWSPDGSTIAFDSV